MGAGFDPKALIGVALVVGFVVIIVLCVLADGKSKKKFMQKTMTAFPMNSGEDEQIFEFIKKHKSDVRKIVNGKED